MSIWWRGSKEPAVYTAYVPFYLILILLSLLIGALVQLLK
jgi:hypothetical protein